MNECACACVRVLYLPPSEALVTALQKSYPVVVLG